MKFAFNFRMTIQALVLVEADTEAGAWAKALDAESNDPRVLEIVGDTKVNKPIFRRVPERDEYDL